MCVCVYIYIYIYIYIYVVDLLVWIINQLNVFSREVITLIATGVGLRVLVTFRDCLLYTKPAQTFMWCRKVQQKIDMHASDMK